MVCVRRQNALILLLVLVLALLVLAMPVVAQEKDARVRSAHAGSALAEIRDKQRALLVVFRSRVVDATGNERAIIDDVLKANPEPRGRFRWVHAQIARKLDKYKRKYRSTFPAEGFADADYVIYFNVLEFRRILDAVYAYGELFVIVKGSPEELRPPRVVWRANKILFAEDAIGNLIKELKAVRGEI
ncbi:MAG TPA: hypothetical protein VFY34_15250 [Pyrinomonadaceae bacterium]|nr:hypothetical protein [Pyrinomonadaceae bacterium]